MRYVGFNGGVLDLDILTIELADQPGLHEVTVRHREGCRWERGGDCSCRPIIWVDDHLLEGTWNGAVRRGPPRRRVIEFG